MYEFLLQDIDKKNILAIQTLRNNIMGSTLMATTSILLCAGLAAVISSTYSVKRPLNDIVYGAHGEFVVALKYVTLLTIFVLSFLCHTLSIGFLNEVSVLVCAPLVLEGEDEDEESSLASAVVTLDYVCELLEKGSVLNTVGNRLFYAALPLLLWTFGPVLVFLSYFAMVSVLYNLDFVCSRKSCQASATVNSLVNTLSLVRDFYNMYTNAQPLIRCIMWLKFECVNSLAAIIRLAISCLS